MTGEGLGEPSPDEDDFEKQMRLTNESDKTTVRDSPSQVQVDDGKVKTAVYRVRWSGYDRTDDTWGPITDLQGYVSMVKAFKESHEKDVERLAADRRRETESKEAHALTIGPKVQEVQLLANTQVR